MKTHLVIHCAVCGSYRKRHEKPGSCRCGGVFVRREAKPYAGRAMPLRVDCAIVQASDRALAELVLETLRLERRGKPIDKLELAQAGAMDYRLKQPARVEMVAKMFRL